MVVHKHVADVFLQQLTRVIVLIFMSVLAAYLDVRVMVMTHQYSHV